MMRNIGKLLLAGVLAMSLCFAVIGCTGGGTTGKSQYDVYYMTDAAYTITGEKTVKAGEDYTFAVTPTAGWDASAMKVTANGKTLTAKDGKYTVAKVEDTLAIYVTGIVAPAAPVTEYVNVTFTGEHVDFTGDSKAVKGEDYEFTAVAYEGYKLLEVKNGDELLMAIDGVYTVEAEADLAITATTEAIVNYDLKTVAGDTPSVGGSVYVGEDNKTHIKVDYKPEDRFMKDAETCHYHEVGFTVSEEAWANATTGANYAIIALKIDDWGTDVSGTINPVSGSGSTMWMCKEGMAQNGFGTYEWAGLSAGDGYTNGSVKMIGLAKGGKFTIRNVDGFKATVLSIEFKVLSKVGDVEKGLANIAKDENGNIYLTNAGEARITLDLTTIFGDACKGKKVHFDVVRLDSKNTKQNIIAAPMVQGKYLDLNATLDENGKVSFDLNGMVGLYELSGITISD